MKLSSIPQLYETLSVDFPDLSLCRIIAQEKEMYRIITCEGEQQAEVSGRFRNETEMPSDFPCVGDYVMCDLNNNETAIIHHLLERQSQFLRKATGTSNTEQIIASNIDILFFCMSLNDNFNIRRVERYLSVGWSSGAIPVIVLTKSDLCKDLINKVIAVKEVALGTDIIFSSSIREDGYNFILPYLNGGRTIAFVGSPGVGKSTMINRLLGEDVQKTDGLRNDDSGHQTSTRGGIFELPDGTFVIDTPVMREFGMWNTEEGLEKSFADIEKLISGCRFGNCTHNNEPGCNIRKALKNGDLDEKRWQAYVKLSDENSRNEGSESFLVSKEKKLKEIATTRRRMKKDHHF